LDPNCDRDSEIGPPCKYPVSPEKRKLLLIGDSHAGHISQAIIDAASSEQTSVTIWKNLACINSVEDSTTAQCQISTNSLFEYIHQNKIDFVVISYFIQESSDHSSRQRFILDLAKQIHNVVIIGKTPVFPDENQFFVSKPIILNPYDAPTSFSLMAMNNIDTDIAKDYENWARSNGFQVIDTKSTYCDQTECSRFENGEWLYRDDDHLSVKGSEKLIPKFRAFISEVD